MRQKKQAKRFSIKWKLMSATGIMVFTVGVIVGTIAVNEGRMEITRQVESRLLSDVKNTTDLIESKMNTFYKTLEVIAETSALTDTNLSYPEKLKRIEKYMATNKAITVFSVTDAKGTMYANNDTVTQVADLLWYKQAMRGKRGFTPPIIARATDKLNMVMAVPIFTVNSNVIGTLAVTVDGLWLSEQIKDIVVGKTGECVILDDKITTIGHKNTSLVKNMVNSQDMAKAKAEFKSFAQSQKRAVDSDIPMIDFYDFEGVRKITAFTKMPSTNWTVIVHAPMREFMGGIDTTRARSIGYGLLVLFISLVITFFITRKMMRPVQATVTTLQDIAEGEGDLTVRLPVKGSDEVTDLAHYFNQTIEKIGNTIKQVKENAVELNDMGQELSGNMTETASSVNQISANIEGVKGQILNQAAGVTETSATMEQIIRTIQSLDARISGQVKSLQELSQIIDSSNETTIETRSILAKNDELIAALVDESTNGKTVVTASEKEVQKILEESGGLMDASSIIQNIASQTNLLAMNAAIEAAHAGEAGKGFAVVADEIRKLAEESSSQAKIITATLKNFSTEIGSVSQSSENIGETFMSIFEKVNQVKTRSAAIMEIAETRKEQSNKLIQIIQNVSDITAEVKDGSVEMLKGGEQVAEEMRKLDELTRVITDSMNEMASGAVQINKAVQEVNEMSEKNKESIEDLTQEVSKFKV